MKTTILLTVLLTLIPGAIGSGGMKTAAATAPGFRKSAAPELSDSERLRWWREARFGLFVHWGPVALKGTEIGWSRGAGVPEADYDALYQQFNPTNFNAAAWVKTAKEAGMKYLVLTSKHHDGFCLWDSQYTDYNITKTPFGRDVIKELAAACRRAGIIFCTYHSICDWYHPDYPLGSPGGKSQKPAPDMDRYAQHLKNQIAELIRKYGPLGILWFDGEWEKPWTQDRGVDLYQWVRSLQPSIIVNNRVGVGREGMEGTTLAGTFSGDYDTPEQKIGQFQIHQPWESCITLCQQWAWKPNDRMKSLDECIRTLVYCAGGDGNLLLNVGPMPDGAIEPRQAERLKEIGNWLKKNGASIYRTRGGPFKPGTWGVSTYRKKTIYLHVLDWAGKSSVALPGLDQAVVKASLLGGGRVEVAQTSQGIEITVPPARRQPLDTIVVLKVRHPIEAH